MRYKLFDALKTFKLLNRWSAICGRSTVFVISFVLVFHPAVSYSETLENTGASLPVVRCESIFEEPTLDEVLANVNPINPIESLSEVLVDGAAEFAKENIVFAWNTSKIAKEFFIGNPNRFEISWASLGRSMYNWVVRFFVPLPLKKMSTDVDKVFSKLWWNYDYSPTAQEVKLLKDKNLYEYFSHRQIMLQRNRALFRTRHALEYVKVAVLIFLSLFTYTQEYELWNNHSLVNDWLLGPDFDSAGNPIVQLVLETTPYPHAAIRIGPNVYYYTSHALVKTNKVQYFKHDRFLLDELRNDSSADSQWNKLLDKANEQGMNVDRTVRLVDLNLTRDQISKLNVDLTVQTHKVYDHFFKANESMYLLSRTLEADTKFRLPFPIDSLPDAGASFLYLMKMRDKDVLRKTSPIGKFSIIIYKSDTSMIGALARASYMTTLEIKFALSEVGIGFMGLERGELKFFEDRVAQYDSKTAELMKNWRVQTENALRSEPQFLAMQSLISKLKNEKLSSDSDQVMKARAQIDAFINDQRSRIFLNQSDVNLTFEQVIVTQYKVEYLEALKAEWLKEFNIVETH